MTAQANVKTDKYRGWVIEYSPPPIPIRDYDWQAYGPGYDAWTADEGDWDDNGEKVAAGTREKLIEAIDEWFAEHPNAIEFETGQGIGELISAEVGRAQINAYVEKCEREYCSTLRMLAIGREQEAEAFAKRATSKEGDDAADLLASAEQSRHFAAVLKWAAERLSQ